MPNLALFLTTCPAYPPSEVSRIYCFQLKCCAGGAAVQGQDVSGEAEELHICQAHPSQPGFLSSVFYSVHTPVMFGSQLK